MTAQQTDDWPAELLAMVSKRPELQPWGNHISLRALEMSVVRDAIGPGRVGRLLEIGCGNGFGSAYLADLADTVIATDLPTVDVTTHSIGLALTRELFASTHVVHAHLIGCSGERLPVRDSSVDLVLGLYSLEHVPDKEACLAETRRVLTPGGRTVFTIPATAWSVLYPAAVYGGLVRRLMTHGEDVGDHAAPSLPEGAAAPSATLWQRFRRSYPRFPLPEPHGAFASYPAELVRQRPSRWAAMFRSSGLRVTEVRPMAVLPHLLLSSLFGDRGFRVYQRLLWLDRILCRLPGAWRVAQFVLIVAERP
jgi:SAM-dependent methyltransferase